MHNRNYNNKDYFSHLKRYKCIPVAFPRHSYQNATGMPPGMPQECRGNAAIFRCRGIFTAFKKMPRQYCGNAAGMPLECRECRGIPAAML